MLTLVAKGRWAGQAPNVQQIPKDYDEAYSPPWDALSRDTVSLSDLADAELNDDPYSALGNDGIDAHTGADTVLDGSHDHALMIVGWALLGGDDEA